MFSIAKENECLFLIIIFAPSLTLNTYLFIYLFISFLNRKFHNLKTKRMSSSMRSKRDDSSITSFVNECVNFTSNVTFYSIESGRTISHESERPVIVLLGKEEDLLNEGKINEMLPLLPSNITCAVRMNKKLNKCVVAYYDDTYCVLVAEIPKQCSRHNCPTRPDAVGNLISTALSISPQKTIDVFYLGDELPFSVATAITQASSHSFSTKNKAYDRAFLEARKTVRVVLRSGNLATIQQTADIVQLTQRLVDAPTNLLDTVTFGKIARLWVDKLTKMGKNVQLKAIDGEELNEEGYGGLYGTGKAGEYPPSLVILSYKPSLESGMDPQEKIALVGKGIVYDTGGLAIKSRDGMCGMKHDMGGAAAVFGGFLSLVLADAKVEISCLLCLADNAIGSKAQRNDDIIILKSGNSVEINNTDAEGRLVLSDGVYHASALLPTTPNIIVDMATLTGAQGIATGTHHAAIYSNSEEAEHLFVKAGKESGNLCFPVLYCPEFHKPEFTSEFADSKNSVSNRSNAQVSCAAHFIEQNLHTNFKGKWIHVDMASPATFKTRATGFGVALLFHAFASELLN